MATRDPSRRTRTPEPGPGAILRAVTEPDTKPDASAPESSRAWDIVVFGATGFAGRLIAGYLDQHAPKHLRLAIAGRDPNKLGEIAAGLDRPFGKLVASVDDPGSLRAMAASARVVLTTVGPYARLGEPVVAACVAAGADYLDLTGEPAFVDRIRAKYQEAARASGSLVIHCCGFDSIPTDLGVLYTIKQLPGGLPITIDGYFEGKAGFSGGTFASALGALAERRQPRVPRPSTLATDRVVKRQRERPHYHKALRRWALPLPTIDPQIALRSARARADYGPEFRYGHYMATRSLSTLVGTVAGIGVLALLARTAPTRALLLRLRPSGTGPDEATRGKSWYRFTFFGRAGDTRVVTEVAGGDPGYEETARMAGESALCLALQRDQLRESSGIQTTATAMGELLLARLQAAGMSFRVTEGGLGT